MQDNEDYSMPFSEYLRDPRGYGKFAIAITRSQYIILTGGVTHEGMAAKIIKSVRPDVETDDWGNAKDPNDSFENDNIIILGYPTDMDVNLPRNSLLTPEQLDKLESILMAVKDYNETSENKYVVKVSPGRQIDIEWDEYQDKIDDLITLLREYVHDYDTSDSKEVIIGESFNHFSKS